MQVLAHHVSQAQGSRGDCEAEEREGGTFDGLYTVVCVVRPTVP